MMTTLLRRLHRVRVHRDGRRLLFRREDLDAVLRIEQE